MENIPFIQSSIQFMSVRNSIKQLSEHPPDEKTSILLLIMSNEKQNTTHYASRQLCKETRNDQFLQAGRQTVQSAHIFKLPGQLSWHEKMFTMRISINKQNIIHWTAAAESSKITNGDQMKGMMGWWYNDIT